MKRYVSVLVPVLFSLCVVESVLSQESEGYIVAPDKVRIFYKIIGSGSDTLVMVHGGPGSSLESIRADLAPLAKGRRVIYYDQRGQGMSQLIKDGKKLGYEHHVADLEAVREHFKLKRMTLFGNSWGGLLASLYAVAYPDRIERMVLHDPAPPTKALELEMAAELGRRLTKLYKPEQVEWIKSAALPETWLNAKDPVAICREVYPLILAAYTYSQTFDVGFKGDLCYGPKETVRQQRTVNAHAWRSLGNFDLLPKLGAAKAPVLVIHGVADVIPQRASELWASGYRNARLLLFDKSGHMSHVEQADKFFPAVETFLKGEFPLNAKKVQPPAN
jgi:proline iminopeptidase